MHLTPIVHLSFCLNDMSFCIVATEAAAVVAQVAEAPEDVIKLSAQLAKDKVNQAFCIFLNSGCVFTVLQCQMFVLVLNVCLPTHSDQYFVPFVKFCR